MKNTVFTVTIPKIRFSVFRLLATLVFCFILSTPNQASINFEAATFNVWTNADETLMISDLNKISSDILGLQEVTLSKLNLIKSHLAGSYEVFSGIGRDGNASSEYNPILFNAREFSLIKGGTFWFNSIKTGPSEDRYGANYNRILVWTLLRHKTSLDFILVMNTHFSHVSEESRMQSQSMIIDHFNEVASDYNINGWVVMGDLNVDSLEEEFLNSLSFDELDLQQNPTHHNGARIDHILVSANNTLSAQAYNYWTKAMPSSDHKAVFRSISFPTVSKQPSSTLKNLYGRTISLRSLKNELVVTADMNSNEDIPPLLANRSEVRTWEKFNVINAGDGFIALKARANDRYVSMEDNLIKKELVAKVNEIRSWEKFRWIENDDGSISLRSGVRNYFVTVEGSADALQGNRSSIGLWEKFEWKVENPPLSCGIHPHLSTWSSYGCNGINYYRCYNGTVTLIFSSDTCL